MAWFSRRRSLVVDEPRKSRFFSFGGRRHLAAVPYPLPKDLAEISRLDFQHYLLRSGFQGNYAAPIENPASILDVGAGSGRWGMEMAMLFPQANVIGIDLAAPTVDIDTTLGHGLNATPGNYTFVQGNVLERLPFPDRSFDFVHQRLLITAIPSARWPDVIQELVRVTKPGGWVELAECGGPQNGGPGYVTLWDTWIELCAKRGVDFRMGHTLGNLLRAGGLGHVTQRHLLFPMGAWGGRIGRMSATDCMAVGQALRAGVIAMNIVSENEYDRRYALAREEFNNPKGKGVLPFYLAYGQRTAA